MPRYIDADKLYEEMQYGIQHEHYDKPFDLLAEILDAPTADVRENVRGEWIQKSKQLAICNTVHWYECSACGHHAFSGMRTDYCPDCGADMRGDKT